jgi:hypothetical protein
VSVQTQKGVQCIEHPLQIGDACHPLNFRGRFRVPCWRDKGPDRPLHLEYRTVYSLLLETALHPQTEVLMPKAVSSNVLYIHPLYPSFTVFSKRFHPLYLLPLQQYPLNYVLYTQIPILETFFIFIFYTYVFVILSNILCIF